MRSTLPASGAKKPILFTLAERLFDDGRLGEAYAYFADFADVRKKLGRLTLPEELMAVVTEAAQSGDYLQPSTTPSPSPSARSRTSSCPSRGSARCYSLWTHP